jgi:hypothetical protein
MRDPVLSAVGTDWLRRGAIRHFNPMPTGEHYGWCHGHDRALPHCCGVPRFVK